MSCNNTLCENGNFPYINDRYGINVTAIAHTQDPLVVNRAAELVPVSMRKPGTKITFWTFTGWQTWQYQPMDVRGWVLPENWKWLNGELYDGEVTTKKIEDGAVTTDKLSDDAVSTEKIDDAAVTKEKLASNSVVTSKINDASVTTEKLANDSVTTPKIKNGSVTPSKVSSDFKEYMNRDLQNQIDSIQIGGWAISQEFGDDEHIGISQKTITEAVNDLNDEDQALDTKIETLVGAEETRAEGVETNLDNRLGIVEQLAEISIGGGDAQIATGSDFNNPTTEQRAKIPTVGAILDGADTTPTSGSGKLVTSGGVYNVINSLKSAGYVFAGVATPSTSPGTPTEKVFYLGGAGTYANFGTSVTVPVGSIGVFKYNGSWINEIVSDGLIDEVNRLDKELYGINKNETTEAGIAGSYWLDNNGVISYTASSVGLHRVMIPIGEGVSFSLVSAAGSAAISMAFVCDSNGNILLTIPKTSGTTTGKTPANSVGIYINYQTTYSFISTGLTTKVDDLITDVSDLQSEVDGDIYNNDNLSSERGRWIDNDGVVGTGTSSSFVRYSAISVTEGDRIEYTTYDWVGPCLILADNSDNIIYKTNTNSGIVEVPANATRLYFTSMPANFSCKVNGLMNIVPQITNAIDDLHGDISELEGDISELGGIGQYVNFGNPQLTVAATNSRWYVSNNVLSYTDRQGVSRLNPLAIRDGMMVKFPFPAAEISTAVITDESDSVLYTIPSLSNGSTKELSFPPEAKKAYINVQNGKENDVEVMRLYPEIMKKYLPIGRGAAGYIDFSKVSFFQGNMDSVGYTISSYRYGMISEMLDVYPSATLTVSTANSFRMGINFYDFMYHGIIKKEWYTSGTIVVPDNASFMRIIIISPSGSSIMPTLETAQPSVYQSATVDYVRAGQGGGSSTDLVEIPIVAPSPQLPADGTTDADFDAETLTPSELYDAYDAIIDGLPAPSGASVDSPTYMTKYSVTGRDASNTFDLVAYVIGNRNRYGWKAANALYAYKNGSTIVYIDSVSPVVGASIYSDAARTDSGKTISSYDATNQRFTASDSVIYTKSTSDNVPVDVIYTKSAQSLTPTSLIAYSENDTSLGTATAVNLTTLSFNGKNYTRCSDFDRDINSKGTICIWANEHGPQSDPAEPAIILYRMAKDLCGGCRNNPFLLYLKKNYKIVLIPCGNPYGLKNHTRNNANNVNINRNYNTQGWASQSDTDKGTYAGSENETQYIMNVCTAIGADLAIDVHCLGYVTENNVGKTHYEGDIASTTFLDKIVSAMDGFSFSCTSYGGAAPNTNARGSDWINYIGVAGGLLEMNAGSYAAEYDGKQHTAHYLEADYTLLLTSIRMWMQQLYPDLSLAGLNIV